jgi:hypothetical protein
MIALIEEPKIVQKILAHLGLPSKPPPMTSARHERFHLSDDLIS